jgi:hypothetical protein
MATAVAHSMSFGFALMPQYKTPSQPTTPFKANNMENNIADNIRTSLSFNKIHKKMRKKELIQQQKRTFRSHSDLCYQQCRHAVVDWVCQAGEVCGLKNLTIHAAIGFVDMLEDITPVDASRIQLVAIACILIAAKMEEQEDKVPRIQALTTMCGNAFSRELILRMESFILNIFKWEVNIVTTINFLEYYLQFSLCPTEVIRNTHIRNYEFTKAHLHKTAEFFVDLSEHHSYFRELLPSVVAAASIAAARKMLGVQPVWTETLQLATSYTLQDIVDCSTSLLSYYHQTFPSQN